MDKKREKEERKKALADIKNREKALKQQEKNAKKKAKEDMKLDKIKKRNIGTAACRSIEPHSSMSASAGQLHTRTKPSSTPQASSKESPLPVKQHQTSASAPNTPDAGDRSSYQK